MAIISRMKRHGEATSIIMLALWFGMAAGLGEGVTHLLAQSASWVTWETRTIAVDSNILWASPLVNTTVFMITALGFLPCLFLARWFSPIALATGFFASVSCYCVLATSGRIQTLGLIMFALGVGVIAARSMSRNLERGLSYLRQSLVPLFGLALLSGLAGAAAHPISTKLQISQLPTAPVGAPNVMLIVLDDLRADHVGAYGYSQPTTPFLDEFAKRGVLFENAFANSSWSLPSHASLFTGRLPYEHGASVFPYDGRYRTLAQGFAAQGYATAGFAANTYFLTRAQGLAIGFHVWENIFTGPVDSARRTLLGRKFDALLFPHFDRRIQLGRMSGQEINSRLFRWIDHRPPRPFFVFLNYMRMHAPYSPSREDAAKFTANPDEVVVPRKWSFHWHADSNGGLNDPRLRNIAYDASLARLDGRLRELFDGLNARGLDRNLVVIITSDHGESLGEHGILGHGMSLYLQEIHVPLIIVYPGRVPPGRRVFAPVGLRNVPGTVADLANVSGFSAENSLARCWSRGLCGSGSVISELSGDVLDGGEPHAPNRQGWIKSVIDARWHFLLQQNGTVSLFNWAADPNELSNLADTSDGKDLAVHFGQELADRIPEVRAIWTHLPGLHAYR